MTNVLERAGLITDEAPTPGAPDAPPTGTRAGPRLTSPAGPRGYRADIEGLRALALGCAVVGYARSAVVSAGGPAGSLARTGVAIGLVVAGYALTRQLQQVAAGALTGERLRFLARRWAAGAEHAVLALALAAITVIIAAAAWTSPAPLRSLTANGVAELIHGRPVTASGPDPLGQLWAVGLALGLCAMLAAIVLAALATATLIGTRPTFRRHGAATNPSRFAHRLDRTIGGDGLLAITLAGSTVVSLGYFIQDGGAGYAPAAWLWTVGLGALTAAAARTLRRLPRAVAEVAGGAGLVLIGFAFLTAYSGSRAGSVALAVFGTAAVIAAGTGAPRRLERVLGESLMQCLGRVAWCWYLWLWPAFAVGALATGRPLDWARQLIAVWASLVLAVATYQLAVHPDRRRRRANGSPPC